MKVQVYLKMHIQIIYLANYKSHSKKHFLTYKARYQQNVQLVRPVRVGQLHENGFL